MKLLLLSNYLSSYLGILFYEKKNLYTEREHNMRYVNLGLLFHLI